MATIDWIKQILIGGIPKALEDPNNAASAPTSTGTTTSTPSSAQVGTQYSEKDVPAGVSQTTQAPVFMGLSKNEVLLYGGGTVALILIIVLLARR